MPANTTTEPILTFCSAAEWRAWLKENHARQDGVYLQLYKKDSGKQTLTYAEALDEALCYGWIDAVKKSYDDESWIQRFVPRRPKSAWSKINREHVERLIQTGKMRAAGLLAVEAAKSDGRWEAAYDSPRNTAMPEDFEQALKASPKAKAFYATLNRANTYAILFRIQSVKRPETRARKIAAMIEMLEKDEKLHP